MLLRRNYAAPPAPSNGNVQVVARKMPEAAYKIEQPKYNFIAPDTSVSSSTFYGGTDSFIDFTLPQTIGQIQAATLRLTVNNTHTAAVDAVPAHVPYWCPAIESHIGATRLESVGPHASFIEAVDFSDETWFKQQRDALAFSTNNTDYIIQRA